MKEAGQLEKQLSELRKAMWIGSLIVLVNGLVLVFWLASYGKRAHFLIENSIFGTLFLEEIYHNAAFVILAILLLSVLSNTWQMVSVYRLLAKLLEKLKDEQP